MGLLDSLTVKRIFMNKDYILPYILLHCLLAQDASLHLIYTAYHIQVVILLSIMCV